MALRLADARRFERQIVLWIRFARKSGGKRRTCRSQLCARGTSRWGVAERKEKPGGNDTGRIVSKIGRQTFDDRNCRQRNARRGDSDWRASSVAVTKTAALPRLVVAALIVMIVPGTSAPRELLRRRSVAVCGDRSHLLDGEATVHGTGVELHRLGQTNGEP